MSEQNKYFAAMPSEKCAGVVLSKAAIFYDFQTTNGWLQKIMSSWRAYYGAYYENIQFSHTISFSGEQGEYVQTPVNHFRNIAQHLIVMTTSSRPDLRARAINSDYKSQVQTILANGILDYYMREKQLETYIKTAVEQAIVMGSGYVKMEWDSLSGEIYDYESSPVLDEQGNSVLDENGNPQEEDDANKPIYEGDVKFTNLSPFDVVFDSYKENNQNDWVVCRSFKNKYDLAAKYPELEHKIRNLQTKSDQMLFRFGSSYLVDTTDDIPVYEFYHRKTEALPQGRYMIFLAEDVVLYDGEMPYRTIPVFRVSPGDVMGTPYGYTPMFDLMPLQEAVNGLYSTIMTNQSAFGVQNVLVPRGSEVGVNSLEGGLNFVEYNPQFGKPEALNLTQTPKEVFDFLQILVRDMETLSGVNSVARGNPEASLRSGSALALVQSLALQFSSNLQAQYIRLLEQIGTNLIRMLQDFAVAKRTVTLIGGISNKSEAREFSSDDLSNISRVVMEAGNPLARCLAKGTEVLMYDGSFKKVEDIVENDLLMGPDSKPRTVESVATGEERMYDIHHKSEKDTFIFGCNESHILSLKYCANDGRYGLKQYDKVDICVKEFLSLPERQQNVLMGYRTGVNWDKKDVSINPYILGMWLGGGHSAVPALTSMDEELVTEWTNYAHSLGLDVRVQDQPDNRSKVYFMTTGEKGGRADRNPFVNELKALDLVNNKHIPDCFKFNDRETRLNLLAGFIDTDGSRVDTTYVISQKDDKLTDDIEFLIRSLGFKVTRRKVPSDSGPSRDGSPRIIVGECNKLTIGGNTWEIPVKLPRKQIAQRTKCRDSLNYGITLKDKGMGTFYGFTLKEEPHFILKDFTVTHNTTSGKLQLAESMLQYQIIKDPAQYLSVVNTGSLESATEDTQKEILLIRAENEMLLNGEKPMAIATEDHVKHIKGHQSVLFDPVLKKDTVLVQNTLEHIYEHIGLLQNTDPRLLGVLGQQALPPMPQPGQPDPSQVAPQQGAPNPAQQAQDMQQLPQGAPTKMQGPGMENPVNVPQPAKVQGELLPNPEMQQQAMGNVRQQ